MVGLYILAVAVLELLAAAAGTGVVTAYCLFNADWFAAGLFACISAGCSLLVGIVEVNLALLVLLLGLLCLFGVGSLVYL